MRHPRLIVALLACSLLTGGELRAQTNGLELVDLSEGGDVFRFEIAPTGSITVRSPDARTWEVLDFEVKGARVGETLHFRVSDPPDAFQPSVNFGSVTWRPISGFALDEAQGAMTFTVTAESERFVVRLREPSPAVESGAPYYEYDDFLVYLAAIADDPRAQITQIGSSLQGRPLYRIIIDTAAPNNPLPKKTFLTTWRQHGDEFSSSYVFEGFLDQLLGRNGLTTPPELLDGVRWIIYPFFNPDGAVLEQRGNANGRDLNRDWARVGCNGSQQIETFTIQCDIEALDRIHEIVRAGDHHTWGNQDTHGGYRYADASAPSSLTTPEYEEARKDTDVITANDPTQNDFQENGGTTGMKRVELFKLLGFLIHTPEYSDSLSSAEELRVKGQGYARAAYDFLYAPRFTDSAGVAVASASLPTDSLFVTADDLDANDDPGVEDTILVQVTDPQTGDTEAITLTETGASTGVFRNRSALPVVLSQGAPQSGDGFFESTFGSTIFATYMDADYAPDASSAFLPVDPAPELSRADGK